MPERRRGEILLFAAALGIRLAWAADLSRLPFFDLPTGDSLFYAQRAARILGGDWIGTELSYPSSPLYPFLIAPFLLLRGRASFWGIYLFQALLDAASAVFLKRTGDSLFGKRAGWIAGTAWALYGLAVFYSADLMEATAAAFLANLFVWLTTCSATAGARAARASDDGPPAVARNAGFAGGAALAAGLGGAALAAGAILRPHFLALIPIAALAVALLAGPGRRGRAAAAFVLAACLVLGLSLGRNYAASGEVVLISPYSGLNAYLGNHRGARGVLAFPSGRGLRNDVDLKESAHAYPEAMEGGPMSEVEVSRFWWGETGREIAADPEGWLGLMLRKMRLFWSSREEPNHLDFDFFRASSLPLSLAVVPFGLVAPLALAGIGLAIHRSRRDLRVIALAILTAAYAAICSLFFVADRFRLPVAGWIVLLAAGALAEILARAASSRPVMALAPAGAAVALGFMLYTPSATVHGAREHVMVSAALAGRGRLVEAETLLRRAIEIDPASAVARYNLARLLASSGRVEEAEAELAEAARRAPEFSAVRAAQGDLARRRGTAEGNAEARRQWADALAIEPYGREADRLRRDLAGLSGAPASPDARR